MHRLVTCIALLGGLACVAITGRAEGLADYRLAGVVDLGQKVLAVLELPDGTQTTITNGVSIDDVRVAAIDRRSLTLERGAERTVLTLAGGSGAEGHAAAVEAAPRVASHTVNAATLGRLNALRDAAALGDGDVLTLLHDALGLPRTTNITRAGSAAEPLPAAAARDLLARIHDQLASGEPVKLYLDGSSADEIYLLPNVTGGY